MADKRISQLIERVDIANNDVLPIVASGATTTNKVTISTIQDWMQDNLDVGVTSVGITIGTSGNDVNVTGSPITTSGNITINIPTATATIRGLLSPSDFSTFNNKLSSVGLSMPSAFVVSNSPLTANGTIAVTGAGTVSQYIRGDGSLADFPEAGGGGSSISYYLNGSVSQGTIGGIAYYEMNKTPILGAGTDFVAIADGYLASFITDAGDPALLEIPGGNWNFETYFSASSGGGTPTFYIELYKVSGSTATLIASNSATPELIAFGTTITPYFSTLAVPQTTLALTDRLALRYYVARSGRTITLHTENSHLCQIITTFTTGLTALNGLTAQVQNFATGTSGTDFNISSTSATHTFNLPDASASARGLVTTGSQTIAGIKTFSSNMNADGGVRLPASGTALPTFVNNISGSGLSSSGSNGFGFNNANNFYFSGSDKGGSVFVVNNTATRNYTFQDTSGVIALTSNIPTNPVGGSGTINQIPKYTSSTTTIGNSNISDNGSDVVISSRTGISLSGQSILFTPNLGGTTNRIETTGGLPLALVTSGSSITLAAGGTTPQITLASGGAVTLTGALNGTDGTFTSSGGSVSISNASDIWYNLTRGSSITNIGIDATGTFYNTNTNHRFLTNSGSTTALTISSTGAATFSSSVTATNHFSTGGSTFATSSGQVGIGTSSFAGDEVLMVSMNGTTNTQAINVKDRNAAASSSTYMVFRKSDDTFQGNIRRAGTDNALYVGGNEYISFGTGGNTERMRITSTGNVGIGTASPSNGLLVLNSTAANGVRLALESSGTMNGIVAIGSNAISGLSTTDMGLWTRGVMAFETGASGEKMRITSGGNVGIGTASPYGKVEITGLANNYNTAPAITLTDLAGDANSNRWIVGNIATDYGSFNIASAPTPSSTTWTPRITINRSGNVGIGTASPSSTLEVRGTFRNALASGAGGQTLLSPIVGVSNGYLINVDTSNNITHTWHTGANAPSMHITSTGSVGIGTASPSALLTVSSVGFDDTTLRVEQLRSGYASAINLVGANDAGANFNRISSLSNGGTTHWQIGGGGTTNTMAFLTGGTERMRITSGGFLKASNTGSYIGVSSSYHEFNNNTSGSVVLYLRSHGASNGSGILVTTPAADSSEYFFGGNSDGVSRVRIFTNGNIQNQNNSYGSLSDIKLKENIEDATPKLDDLMKVKVRNYNLIGDDKKQIGVIAQELEEVFPAMIDESEDFEEVEVPQVDEEGNEILNEEGEVVTTKERVSKGTTTKSVKYSVFVPMLIKAMQEQQEQIKSLTEQVEALKSQING